MSRYIEVDTPEHCPNAKNLYDESGFPVVRVCKQLWYEQDELIECSCSLSEFPDFCLLKV